VKLVSIGWSTNYGRTWLRQAAGFQDSDSCWGSSSIINCGNQYYIINTDRYRLIHLIVVWCWWICETNGNLMSSFGSPLRTKDGNTCRIWPTCKDLILASTIRFTVEKYDLPGSLFWKPQGPEMPRLLHFEAIWQKGNGDNEVPSAFDSAWVPRKNWAFVPCLPSLICQDSWVKIHRSIL